MTIRQLTIKNFRNLYDVSYKPHSGINFLIGKNAQGKTSILEAISYLSNLYSFRQAQAQHLVNWQSLESSIAADLEQEDEKNGNWTSQVQIKFTAQLNDPRRFRRQVWVNQKIERSAIDYIAQRFQPSGIGFHAISFNPSDHDLVQGEPSLRRQYLNQVLSGEDLNYLKDLKNYQKALEQRNRLLKSFKEGQGGQSQEAILEEFTRQVIDFGSRLVLARLNWLKSISDLLSQTLKNIASLQAELSLTYVSSLNGKNDKKSNYHQQLPQGDFPGQCSDPSLESIVQAFHLRLKELQYAERHIGVTLVGPHRDDCLFSLGREPLKGHGSQGEVRSSLLALKLTEIQRYQQVTGLQPVLLLDDFSSELDQDRRQMLLQMVEDLNLQVFVTATEDLTALGLKQRTGGSEFFHVQNGNLRSRHTPTRLPIEMDGDANYDNANSTGRIFSKEY